MNDIRKPRTLLLSALALAALLVLPAAQASTLSKADYNAAKSRISADYKSDSLQCKSLSGNSRDVCVEQAKGREKVSRAELEFEYTAKEADRNRLMVARTDAAYAVAKEKCDDLAGNPKDVCVQEAKAAHAKALADAKLARTVGTANVDAAQAKREADYKVAAEKCDALAGEAKEGCIAAAKASAGKT